MAHLALYSFSVGMTPEQQLALVKGEREPELAAAIPEPEPAAEPEPEACPAPPVKPRRARSGRGTYRADDPMTPENEAYEREN